jgi:hypothetical protein
MDVDNNSVPDFWTPIKPRQSEGRRCNGFARASTCALKVDGLAKSPTRFKYVIDALEALPGDTLTLKAYARTKNALTGATIRVIARYTNAPAQKRIIRAPLGTADYTELSAALALSGTPSKVQVVIGFHEAGAKGKTWFDDVSLTLIRLARS